MKRFAMSVLFALAALGSMRAPAAALASDGIAASVPQFIQVAQLLGPASPTQKIHLVVFLAYPNDTAVTSYAQAVNDPFSSSYGQYLTPTQFASAFGPTGSTYSTVEYVLQGAGFQIVQTYADRLIVDAVGTVGQAEALFGTVINYYAYNGKKYYANPVRALVPAALKGIVMAVAGFNNFAKRVSTMPKALNPLTTPFGYGPADIRTAYNEPVHVSSLFSGTGVTVGVATAFDYLSTDVSGYLAHYGVIRTGALQRVFVADPVPIGVPLFGVNDETTLDVEQVTANAPGAKVLVYEARDNLNSTFDDMYGAIVNNPHVDVVTTSWGSCEVGNDINEMMADNNLFKQGAIEGQTWIAAAGDNGSTDCGLNNPPDGLPGFPNPVNVDFPSSSPYVAAAGGTTLKLTSLRTRLSETAWSRTGGGVSRFFALPKYQSFVTTLASITRRNTPDFALDADIATPYALFYFGSWAFYVGGTSAVAPNMAAMYAQFDQYWGRRLGLAQAGLYNGLARGSYTDSVWYDIVSGNNGTYFAHSRYDNVSGVGSLNAVNYMRQIPLPKFFPL